MRKNTDDYFDMSQEELEKENQEIGREIGKLRERQTVLARALDNRIAEATARYNLENLSDAERAALKKILVG